MSGLEIAGVVVGVVPVIFKTAIDAWKTVDDAVTFEGDAEDLGIRLESVKAQLGLWAAEAGLTEGELVPALLPQEELIARTLRRICDLLSDAERQGKKYGIVAKDTKEVDLDKAKGPAIQMSRVLHSILNTSKSRGFIDKKAERNATLERNETTMSRRAYWAVRDKDRFTDFVDTLEKHVKGLQSYVGSSDRKRIQQQGTRLIIELLRQETDPGALSQLLRVSGWDDDFSQMDINSLAQWKMINLLRTPTIGMSTLNWGLKQCSFEERSRVRFLKASSSDPASLYLFEKKEYDPNISDELKDLLQERIRKLIDLLGGPGAQRYLHTLHALGYSEDPDYHCWWIVFRFPLAPPSVPEPNSSQPLSLRAILSSPSKPALEVRYLLAKRLVDTLARLYASDWMHKGISSKNIIFPQSSSATTMPSLETALVQGFNYSRQLTQAQTIDRGKVLGDLESAIYRHPFYQGETASGYQIHYDIYSLGLILFEVALWGPLMDMLAAKYRPGKEPPVALSTDMQYFHEVEALELKRRVMMRVDMEVAYRVGTKYKDVVKWCLSLTGPVTAIEFYNMVAIPLDEICAQI
ncbi:prion-inhibition and propagation-domain-containing protein [Clohesyomyces aquaticus]|uniref:Prion-inhibition and propagation-domain-containing protein n=1 Tax=Clohesyomyces aquaticus TaxID=1231657 RepID=A0A1Y1ZP61_9PLEO|nr:prion-inhibition and propagation-domain-containing protein [Clohesyomyces aquaticus]